MLTIYIGYDSREPEAYDVAKFSIIKNASRPVNIQPLKLSRLEMIGLLTRKLLRKDGQFYDPVSRAPASTEFSISRFLAVIMQQSGHAIFMDCDMVITGDVYDILDELDPSYAVQCVKHNHIPKETEKMDGQIQTIYKRKNWSSFFVINSDHPANDRLTLDMINKTPGRDLHAFSWLEDDEIGDLSPGWNWLVNVQEKPEKLYNAHFTLGGPWFKKWEPKKHDDLWLIYRDLMEGKGGSV